MFQPPCLLLHNELGPFKLQAKISPSSLKWYLIKNLATSMRKLIYTSLYLQAPALNSDSHPSPTLVNAPWANEATSPWSFTFILHAL